MLIFLRSVLTSVCWQGVSQEIIALPLSGSSLEILLVRTVAILASGLLTVNREIDVMHDKGDGPNFVSNRPGYVPSVTRWLF